MRTLPFETAIIHRYLLLPLHNVRTPLYDAIFRPKQYQRKEINVKEAMVEMYLAGVSVRRVKDIKKAPWGAKVSAGAFSKLN